MCWSHYVGPQQLIVHSVKSMVAGLQNQPLSVFEKHFLLFEQKWESLRSLIHCKSQSLYFNSHRRFHIWQADSFCFINRFPDIPNLIPVVQYRLYLSIKNFEQNVGDGLHPTASHTNIFAAEIAFMAFRVFWHNYFWNGYPVSKKTTKTIPIWLDSSHSSLGLSTN